MDAFSLRRTEDCFVDQLFGGAPDHGAPLLRALVPRAYIDLNREPFELDPAMFSDALPDYVNTASHLARFGFGTIPRIILNGQEIYKRKLRFAEAQARIITYYRPYHAALSSLIREARQRFGYCILVDCHSMPSTGGLEGEDDERRRTHFVIGDCYGSACAPYITDLIESTLTDSGFILSRNRPFAGGFTTRHYGAPRKGVHAVQIEINRSLYMNETTLQKHRGFPTLRKHITGLVEALNRLTTRKLAAE